jgi:hypothetical protein
VSHGASQTFTFTPAEDFKVADVQVDGVSQGAADSYAFENVTESHTISVTFIGIDVWLITASAEAGGSIDPEGTVEVNDSENSPEFTITANDGYEILDVLVDGVSQDDVIDAEVYTYIFENVTDNHTIEATFKEADVVYFEITVIPGDNGSIIRQPEGDEVEIVEIAQGDSQIFLIKPATGYKVDRVEVNGAEVDVVPDASGAVNYTLSDVDQDYTIEAFFVVVPTWTITATAGEGGTITPSGEVTVNDGASQKFEITTDTGYRLASLEVDNDVYLDPSATYTFEDVREPHTIHAVFEELPPDTYVITATSGENGTISPETLTVDKGDSATFIITPDDGYEIADVQVDDSSVGARTTYIFTNITSSHTIEAFFEVAEIVIDVDTDGDGVADVTTSIPSITGASYVVNSLRSVDIGTTSSERRPGNLNMGLIAFDLELLAGETSAVVTLQSTGAVPDNAQWFVYDEAKGAWSSFPDAVFNEDGTITLTITDGGLGDSDGDEVNGSISVAPGGFGTPYQEPVEEEGAGDDNCFISTAANGSGNAGFGFAFLLAALFAGCAAFFFGRRRG